MKRSFIHTHLKLSNSALGLLLLFTFLILHATVHAQDDKREKIEAMKVSFLTQKIDLNSKEAQVFWPLYNDYSDKVQALRKLKRKEQK